LIKITGINSKGGFLLDKAYTGRKIVFVVFLPILLILLNPFVVEAAVIGINKVEINFKNVLKNGYAQDIVTLSTDTDYNLSITYRVEGEIANWIRVEPSDQPFFINKDSPNLVLIIIEPPSDVKNQHYNGSIRFITGALAGPQGQFGTAVRAAVNIRLGLDVVGQEIVDCRALGFEMDDVEEGYPLEFYAVVTNQGNVKLRPRFVLEFWNQDQSELVKSFDFTLNESLLPTVEKRIFYSISHNLPLGQYWVKIKTPSCGESGNGFLTMSLIERGGVSDQGELVGIENEPWAKVGDIIPIDAVFKNIGTRVVSAKFKGTIASGEEIFKIIDTDALDVMPGETAKLRTYFNPAQQGQYMISGRILYNKKLTFEKSSVLNVNPSGKPPSEGKPLNWSIILVVLVIIIIVLIIFIVRRKRELLRGRHRF